MAPLCFMPDLGLCNGGDYDTTPTSSRRALYPSQILKKEKPDHGVSFVVAFLCDSLGTGAG